MGRRLKHKLSLAFRLKIAVIIMAAGIPLSQSHALDLQNSDLTMLNGYSLGYGCFSCSDNKEIQEYYPIHAKKQHLKDMDVKKFLQDSAKNISYSLSFSGIYKQFNDNFKVRLGENSIGRKSVHLIPKHFEIPTLDKFDIELSRKELWFNGKIYLK